MKSWTTEIVHIAHEDGQKVAMWYQNGEIEVYKLKKFTKQDTVELLETDVVEIEDKLSQK